MNFIASLRNALNCNLRDFGSLFDISSTTIFRTESGLSTLPSKCNIALLTVQISIEEVNMTSKIKEPTIPTLDSSEIEKIRMRNNEITSLIPRLQKDLLAMADEYIASEKALIYLSHILANPDKFNKSQVFWVEDQIAKQKLWLEKTNMKARLDMEIKIAKLDAEWQVNERVLGQNPLG